MMVVYVIKYALTRGIERYDNGSKQGLTHYSVKVSDADGNNNLFYNKGEFCLTREEAIAKVKAMKQNRIALLEKQLQRLKALRVKVKNMGKDESGLLAVADLVEEASE